MYTAAERLFYFKLFKVRAQCDINSFDLAVTVRNWIELMIVGSTSQPYYLGAKPEFSEDLRHTVELPRNFQNMMNKVTSDSLSTIKNLNVSIFDMFDRELIPSSMDLLRKYESQFSQNENNYSVELLSDFYGQEIQKRFGTLIKSAAELAKDAAYQYNWNSYQRLAFLAVCRWLIARELRPIGQSGYGLIRCSLQGCWREQFTELHGCYECLADFYKNSFSEQDDYQCDGLDFFGNKIYLSYISWKECDKPYLKHTDGMAIEQALAQVHYLYQQALEATEEGATVNLCGQMFWWLCHAKPWVLGDPSTGEMFFRSLLAEKGIESFPWLSTIIPWVEAMKSFKPEEFGENFQFLFKSKFH